MSKAKKSPKKSRRKARELALQALYQLLMSGEQVRVIEQQFIDSNSTANADADYFHTLLHGVAASIDEIDQSLQPLLDRPFKQLDPIETALLRLGCFELMHQPDVPYRVVINESIEIAKRFGAQDSHKYINGILDKLAPSIRETEVKSFQMRRDKKEKV